MKLKFVAPFAGVLLLGALAYFGTGKEKPMLTAKSDAPLPDRAETISFGAGCFWCTEAVYQRVDGVLRVTSGYQGGHAEKPTYKEVCAGTTGHAEVIRVDYDPEKVAFDTLLETFWKSHDPTQLNRQGADIGTQYRSAVYTTTQAQKEAAEAAKEKLNEDNTFGKPVVTEIAEAGPFFAAEDYHQDYYNNNRRAPYCAFNITPKLKKLGME
jgi:peptide-methionine (S)-S-oxide reductase